jgi:hypothetical protein
MTIYHHTVFYSVTPGHIDTVLTGLGGGPGGGDGGSLLDLSLHDLTLIFKSGRFLVVLLFSSSCSPLRLAMLSCTATAILPLLQAL